LYYTNVTATEANPQQRVGKVNSIGYDPKKDALIISAKYVKVGPQGYFDIYDWNPSKIFQVVYRNTFVGNNPMIYSIDILPTLPDVTMNTLTSAAINNADDSIANDPLTVLDNRGVQSGSTVFTGEPNSYKMMRFKITDPSPNTEFYFELYRLNFYTFDHSITSYPKTFDCTLLTGQVLITDMTGASVFLTDVTGTSNLYIDKYMNLEKGINVLSLFDGISCGQLALERAGIKVNKYYASEIDKHAIKVTQQNYPNTIQLGSVTDLKGSEFFPSLFYYSHSTLLIKLKYL
jgi:hypothetical protein